MTKDEKQYLADAASLGCLACRMDWLGQTPAEIHHPRDEQGMSQRASHDDAIPLCAAHHRGTQHPLVPSIHLDRLRFVRMYGCERELVARTRQDVAELRQGITGRAG
ncbi:Ref family recombination enhancement nuclease [Pseudaeromonas paramecii]|uniref:Ref family recombination enhancement nuclease n=1 Tax=Pseudaeromonas paramecii TaxID=2138166 RepID=A0ABP8PYK6_9GAMM